MDWKQIAQLAAPVAPTLGKILGGLIPFPGGAMLGEWAGNAIASALGVPATPDAVGAAIQNTPADQLEAKFKAIEAEAVARWDALARMAEAEAADRTAQSQAINETMRMEAGQVPWWHWRHLLGYVLVLLGTEVATLFPLVVFGKISATDMAAIIAALTPITGIFAALNGYIAQDSTKRVTTAITGEHAPSVTDNVVSAVKKAVAKPAAVKVTTTTLPGRDS